MNAEMNLKSTTANGFNFQTINSNEILGGTLGMAWLFCCKRRDLSCSQNNCDLKYLACISFVFIWLWLVVENSLQHFFKACNILPVLLLIGDCKVGHPLFNNGHFPKMASKRLSLLFLSHYPSLFDGVDAGMKPP